MDQGLKLNYLRCIDLVCTSEVVQLKLDGSLSSISASIEGSILLKRGELASSKAVNRQELAFRLEE